MNLSPQELNELNTLVSNQADTTNQEINDALKAHDAKEFNAGISRRTVLYDLKAKISLALDELQVAARDLEDEYADGLITAHAYTVRKEELRAILEGAK
jgi:hypothetical protein